MLHARLLLSEVLSHQLAALPAMLVMVLAFVIQSFVVPLQSAKLLDETTGATNTCASTTSGEEQVCSSSGWFGSALARICAMQLVALCARSLERLLTEKRTVRVKVALQQKCFAAIMRQDDAWLDTRRVAELVGTVRDPGVAYLCCDVAPTGLRAMVALFGGVIAMIKADRTLASVAVSTAPVLFAVQKLRNKMARRAARRGLEAQASAQVVATEALHHRSTVRAHAAEGIEAASHQSALMDVVAHAEAALQMDVLLDVLSESLVSAGELALLGVAAHRKSLGALTLGTYAAFRAGLLQYQRGLRESTRLANKVAGSLGKAERYTELITLEPTILGRRRTAGSSVSSVLPPRVEFLNVSFGYSVQRLALEDINLTLEPQTTTALVGTSGSGKSTMGSLLLRLFDPQKGQILIDGSPLTSLDVVAHRRRIGVVQQEPCLFDRTVAENIAYGLDPPPSRARIVEAAVEAQLDKVIERLPKGYEERLGEHSRLSGGEKQRLAIARAMVRDPTLLLLDEATSALDAASEALVLRALLGAAVGRTTLTIAHRLATIRTADVIAVMDKGRIVQRGTHDELVLEKQGLYAGLVSQQLGSPPPPKLPPKQTLLNVDLFTRGNHHLEDDDDDDDDDEDDIAQHNAGGSLGF